MMSFVCRCANGDSVTVIWLNIKMYIRRRERTETADVVASAFPASAATVAVFRRQCGRGRGPTAVDDVASATWSSSATAASEVSAAAARAAIAPMSLQRKALSIATRPPSL